MRGKPRGKEATPLQIAICDDEREEILKIRNLIFNIQDNYRVDPFLNGQSLLEAVEEGKKVILIDGDPLGSVTFSLGFR